MVYIKKIEITSFGKFSGFELEFYEGLNEFYFENEYGKSTIVDFMVFMLYGFTKTASKKRGLSENPLKKYMPWNGDGIISGAMELVKDGALYRIERKQRESGRMALTVRNESGAELSGITEPGEHFFGVDMNTFLKTFLVRQTDMKFGKTDGIVTALNNLVTTGDEQTSFEGAMAALRQKKTKYQHGEMRRGRIFDIPQEILQLKSTKAEYERQLAALSESKVQSEQICTEIEQLEGEEDKAAEILKKAKAAREIRLLQKLDALDKEAKSITPSQPFMISDDSVFAEMAEVFDSYDAAKAKAEESRIEIQQLEESLSGLLNKCKGYDIINSDPQRAAAVVNGKGKINAVLVVAGIAVMLLSAVLGIFINTPLIPIAVCAVGAMLTVLAFVIRRPVKVPPEYQMSLEELKNAYSVYTCIKPEADVTRAMLEKEKRAYALADDRCGQLKQKTDRFKQDHGISDKQQLIFAQNEAKKAELENSRLNIINSAVSELLAGRTREQLEKYRGLEPETDVTVTQADDRLRQIKYRQSELMTRSAALEKSREKAGELEKQIFELNKNIRALEKELKTALYGNEVLDIAIKAMSEAYDEINKMYSPILTQKAEKPLLAFTDGKYGKVYLDRDFNIRVKADGELKEIGYFSKGTAEAIYFAVRYAVSELISEDAGVPVVMDDPFWALDSERRKNALEFLKKLAGFKQVIIFGAK